jgi:hypothetical protein
MPKPLSEPNAVLHQSDIDDVVELLFDEYLLDAGGELVFPRSICGANSPAAVSQGLRLAGFRCKKTAPVTTISVITGTTAAAATPSLIRYGLYEHNGAGTYTLVASTVHDATLLVAANTAYPKAVSTAYTKKRGFDYMVAVLIVSGAALPTFNGPPLITNVLSQSAINQPPRYGNIAGQADLPATFLASSIAVSLGTHQALLT